MSKINPSIKKKSSVSETERLAGGLGAASAKQDNYSLLNRLVMANLLGENIAYSDGMKVTEEIKRLIPLCDPKQVQALAIDARVSSKLRHIPLFLLSEMCKYEEHKKYVEEALPQVITRPDMLTDFLAIYWKDGKKPICHRAKRGLAEAFHNFDEYQFAKYDRESSIKIRDVMFLTRPKPKNAEEKKLFKKIADRNLSTPMTWEVMLSSGADKRKTWEKLIADKKIGGLAMLRNIANMGKANVPKSIIKKGIENISSSMLTPLDFLKSARMNPSFYKDINNAMVKSYSYLPKLKGNTLFILDVSGSMSAELSSRGQFTRKDAAIALTILALNQAENCKLVITAGDDYRREHKSLYIENPYKDFRLESQVASLKTQVGGGGIFTRQCLEWCEKKFKGEEFDRIIVCSDSQDCDYASKRIPKPFGKKNYICDISSELRGINYKGAWTAEIVGFSEHFLSFISVMEGNSNMFEID